MSGIAQEIIHLMIVDDHEVLRDGLKFMLRNEPDVEIVAEASDGAEALKILETLRPDVMLLDWMLPSMSAIEVAKRVRA